MSRTAGPALRIGIAVGARSATAVIRTAGSAHVVTVPADFTQGEARVEPVREVLRALGLRVGDRIGAEVGAARVRFALLPPLADARMIALPPLRRAEAEAVIRRDAARHFVGGTGSRIVAAAPAGARTEGGVPFFAAAASAALVDALYAAGRGLGWQVEAVVPAHAAWVAAATSERSRRSGTVLAVEAGAAHVLQIARGRCVSVRRAPTALDDEVLRTVGAGPGTVLLLADAASRDGLGARLATAGWTLDHGRLATAAEAAARHAARSRLDFVPAAVAADRLRAARRNAGRAALAAGLLLAGAAAVELWGANRELAAVRAERAAIHETVAPLLAARDSIDRIGEEVRAIRMLESASPRWTRALFDLAMLLPRDAHVTALHTTGDTLVVEATGARAGEALQALRKAGSLADIRLVGTIERDLEGGATTTERFRFTARLKPPPGLATVPRGAGVDAGTGATR